MAVRAISLFFHFFLVLIDIMGHFKVGFAHRACAVITHEPLLVRGKIDQRYVFEFQRIHDNPP